MRYCVVKTERYWVEADSEEIAISVVTKLDNSSALKVDYEVVTND
jgi:hypothetical protein